MSNDVVNALLSRDEKRGRFYGMVVGIVTNNQDPDSMHRVKVQFPWLSQDYESNWARMVSPMAGKDRGIYFLPEVGDEVVVAFQHGSIDHPYVMGAVWNGKDTAPESNQDGENNMRAMKSRSGHVVRFNDKAGGEAIEIIDKTGNNKIVIDTAENSVTIEAQGDITINSVTGKLTITAAKGIEMTSQAGVEIKAATSMDLKAGAQVNVKGAMINLN
ncbi:MAG: phage baseplate assembly protein V [Pseudomonadota bacterium]